MISLTDSAKDYLANRILENTDTKKYAYLQVKGGGCTGFKYDWSFTDDKESGELIDNILVIDKLAEMFLIGCEIDYVQELGGSYLQVKNPNANAQCGCGESFSI